jgi:hypothetical protein
MTIAAERRKFITLAGAAVCWPLAARAQPGASAKQIGVLVHGSQTDPVWEQRLATFRQELEVFRWQDGRNIHLEIQLSTNTTTTCRNCRKSWWRKVQ